MSKVIVSNSRSILYPKNNDAGYDLIACSDPKIVGATLNFGSPYYAKIDYIEYEVDLRIEPDAGLAGFVFPRSSISKYQLSLCNSVGVIDNGYRGLIKIRFNYLTAPYDLSIFGGSVAAEVNFDAIYKKGDKIAQMVFFNTEHPLLIEGIPSDSERAENGFGSTGE